MNRSIPKEIRNARGERLEFTFHPGTGDSAVLILLGHGVTGNKDRPLLVELANALSQGGVHALRFSFSGNGGSEGRFEESTITKEVQDLGAVLEAVPGWTIGYAGHSMGAAVGVLRAATDSRIRFLISLAGMAHTAAFAQREFGSVTPGAGVMWDNAACPLSPEFMEDMRQIDSVLGPASHVRVPWLFVHGTVDDVVPIQDSRDLFATASAPKKLVEIPGADHVFSEAHAAVMAQHVATWVRELQL